MGTKLLAAGRCDITLGTFPSHQISRADVADAALAFAFRTVEMSLRTMSFRVRDRAQGDRAATKILSVRHRLKMRRIDTMADPAEVVESQPIRDAPYQLLIGISVGEHRMARDDSEASVAGGQASSPNPASITLRNQPPEAHLSRSAIARPIICGISVTPPALVVQSTPTPTPDFETATFDGANHLSMIQK